MIKIVRKHALILVFLLVNWNVSLCQGIMEENKLAEKVPAVFIVNDPPIDPSYHIVKEMEDVGLVVDTNSIFERTYLSNWRDLEKSSIIPNTFFNKFIDWAIKKI